MKRFPFWLCYALLALAGCDLFDSNKKSGSRFIGEWESLSRYHVWTLEDSLGRDSLDAYMAAHGIDLDSFMDNRNDNYDRDSARVFKAMREFKYECPRGPACKDTLWIYTAKQFFTLDSVTRISYQDSVVTDSYTDAYSFTEDSLYLHYLPEYSLTRRYEFRTRDTLILFNPFGISEILNDTLVRVK